MYTLFFFHKTSINDDLPLKLPDLKIPNNQAERKKRFLGTMLGQNMNWKEHIRRAENKIAKHIGILYCIKYLLNELSLKCIYFAHIHSYQNYANIA